MIGPREDRTARSISASGFDGRIGAIATDVSIPAARYASSVRLLYSIGALFGS